MNPQISVVIIALNEENYLPLLLNDLVAQTQKEFEVVIVDGGSTDKTKEKTIAFGDILHLHFIASPTAQMSFQRNYGAKHAKGKYLFFLDADSRLPRNAIEILQKHITQKKQLLYLPMVKPSGNRLSHKIFFAISTQVVKISQHIGKPLSFGPFIVIEKELFNAIGGFDEKAKIAEDHNIIIKADKKGIKAVIVHDLFVSYSMRRFEKKGGWKTIFLYIYSVIVTLNKGAVFDKKIDYPMGGQEYK